MENNIWETTPYSSSPEGESLKNERKKAKENS